MHNFIKAVAVLVACAGLSTSLIGCGDKTKSTQGKVEVANADKDRMGKIDEELRAKGVFTGSPDQSQNSIDKMDHQALNQIDLLLEEFIRRGNNFVSFSRSPGVQYSEEKTRLIELWIRSAEKVRESVNKRRKASVSEHVTSDTASSTPHDHSLKRDASDCPEFDGLMAPTSIPQGAGFRYVMGLKKNVSSRVDWLSVRTTRKPGSCRVFNVEFRDKNKGDQCSLNVVVNYDVVDARASDRVFHCH